MLGICFLEAVKGILMNRRRAFSAMIGIMIGICSVLMIQVVGNTIIKYINDASVIGDSYLSVYTSIQPKSMPSQELLDKYLIDEVMIDGFSKLHLGNVNPIIENDYGTVEILSKEKFLSSAKLIGATDGVFETQRVEILSGRGILSEDQRKGCAVCVISENLAQMLGGEVINKELMLYVDNNISCNVTIVGIFSSNTILNTGDLDEIYLPVRYIENRLGKDEIKYDMLEWAIDEIKNKKDFLKKSQRYFDEYYSATGWEVKVEIDTQDVEFVGGILKIFMTIVSIIAVIAFLVGEVNVMNIMLINVLERIKEIGIRKAVGATNKCILMQFMIESILISMIACIIGVVLGIIFSGVGVLVFSKIFHANLWFYLMIQIEEISLYVLVSILLGIISGVYPAFKAVKMTVTDAVRHE